MCVVLCWESKRERNLKREREREREREKERKSCITHHSVDRETFYIIGTYLPTNLLH